MICPVCGQRAQMLLRSVIHDETHSVDFVTNPDGTFDAKVLGLIASEYRDETDEEYCLQCPEGHQWEFPYSSGVIWSWPGTT